MTDKTFLELQVDEIAAQVKYGERQKCYQELFAAIRELENTWEYGTDHDTFGDGWDHAKQKIQELIIKKSIQK